MSQETNFDDLTKEIRVVKELNDKTKELLLLELESKLDKENQLN